MWTAPGLHWVALGYPALDYPALGCQCDLCRPPMWTVWITSVYYTACSLENSGLPTLPTVGHCVFECSFLFLFFLVNYGRPVRATANFRTFRKQSVAHSKRWESASNGRATNLAEAWVCAVTTYETYEISALFELNFSAAFLYPFRFRIFVLQPCGIWSGRLRGYDRISGHRTIVERSTTENDLHSKNLQVRNASNENKNLVRKKT